jgi:TonB-linked SusC/RagA family outer membrane protein
MLFSSALFSEPQEAAFSWGGHHELHFPRERCLAPSVFCNPIEQGQRIMLKKILAVAFVVSLVCITGGDAYAQEGVITGTVIDSTTSESIPGANVVVDELGAGAATNTNGEFRIPGVPVGSYTLQVSFIGYMTKQQSVDVQAGETTEITVELAPRAVELDDVVVTALGVERQARSLGYSVQEVEGAELDNVGELNFVGTLTGRVAGAQISNSSQMGGSSRIILRGASSVSGNNEPLIVVDGVPLDNSAFNNVGQQTGSGGYDYGNAASTINPSEIQSVTILKGPSAAALYGSRAANGVIEITTKSGAAQEGIGVTVQTGATFNEMYNLPDYQNEYGGGSWGPFSMNEQGQFVADFGTDQSWGPPLDGRPVRQWYSYDNVNGLEGETTPWVAHPNNVENFFRTGATWNTNVAFSQGGNNFNYRVALNNVMQRGTSPQSNLERQTVSFNGALDLTERLTTSLSANYLDEKASGRPGSGYTNATGPWLQFNHFGQRQIDLSEDAPMRNIVRPDGTQRGWNWIGDPRAGNLIYANNPFWIRERNYQNDDRERVYGNLSISYDLASNLTLSGSARTDFYTSRRQERIAIGSVEQSNYAEDVYEVQESNFSGELSYDGQLTEDFSLRALGGVNYRYSNYSQNLGDTEGGLATPELFTLENSISRPDIEDYFQEQGLLGLYGDVTVGYQELVYLGGSLRNDWSSTLPADNNSYLYPSVTASFVFSSLPALQDADALSYGKLRVNWSQVGRDTDPYRLSFTYPLNTPYGSTPMQSLLNSLNNENLEPEIKTGWEVGTELQFVQNRVGLDATYYSEETRNQILGVEASRASGFESRVINAGTISNEGVELVLNLTPVLTERFRWNLTINWSRNVNEVVELAEGVESVPLNSTDSTPPFGPEIVAREGEPYGSFFGPGFVYDDDGNKVISGGAYDLSESRVLGTYLPDWNSGVSTTLSYEGFTASVLVDGQKGGKIWSLSNLFGLYSGIFQETVENDIRQVGLIPEGVTESGEEWSERVDPNAFFASLFGNHEAHLYDASFIKLREVSLSYQLPQQWFGGVAVQGLTLTALGRNLATLLKYTPNFDPTAVTRSSSNLQGIEAGQLPPQRVLGFRLRLTL